MGQVHIVRASAGSGKTYRLAFEYIRRALASPEAYRHILAVTFTNKATDEMKGRIVREINDLANGKTPSGAPPAFAADLQKELHLSVGELQSRAKKLRSRVLHDYGRFTVLTIDKFFQRIVRAFIRELGVESDFTLELQSETLLGAAADRLIEQTLSDSELREWIGRFIDERIDEGRGWDVKRELAALGRELFSEEYRRRPAPPRSREEMQKIVGEALARTEKVRDEMVSVAQRALQILDRHGLTREDFPYGKSGFINYFYKTAAGDVWEPYGKRVTDAREEDGRWVSKTSARKGEIQAIIPTLKPLLNELCAMYDRHAAFARTTGLIAGHFRAFGLLNDLAEQVRAACGERNVLLLSETNALIDRLIAGNDAPFIFEKAGNRFLHFLIDEFQDTSAAQWGNFVPLLHNALAQSEDDPVLLVGDVKQSIYRWRGGDWEILGARAAEAFPETAATTLDHNWRSAGNVVRFNNGALAAAAATADAELNARLDEAREKGVIDAALHDRLHGILPRAYADCRQKIGRKSAENEGHIRLIQYTRDGEGRRWDHLIETIEELQRRGFRPADIAILVRRNAEAVETANFLLEYKSAYPDSPYGYDVITQEALVIGRAPVVRFAAACFRLAVNPRDSIARGVYLRWLGRPVDEALGDDEKAFLDSLRRTSPEEAFEQLLLHYRPDRQPGSTAYLQAFHDQLLAFGANRVADLPLFLKWWDETGARQSIELPAGQNAITILTIHKSKGLEFPAVILPCATWETTPGPRTLLWTETGEAPFAPLGKMPVKFRREMAESAFAPDFFRETVYAAVDNLNLLYVALTRAREELVLMMPRVKEPRGERVSDLLLRALAVEGTTVRAGDFAGTVVESGDERIYTWGEPVEHEKQAYPPERSAEEYPTFPFTGRLRLRRESERYRDGATGEIRLSPRGYGRLMHRVLESVATADEIGGVLDRFEAEGVLASADRTKLSAAIEAAFADETVRGWFDGSWSEVRNESDIVVPSATASLRRPDRVMIREGRVVVVDYKFGQKEHKAHLRQVGEYMELIRRMGYPDVRGFIWYVEGGKVVSV